jgi:unsaturated rhamnogalacturonyl hydrolase
MNITNLIPSLEAAALGIALIATSAVAQETQSDLSGRTDDSIREIIRRVARHQQRELKDGDYPAVQTLAEAAAAKPPEGISWSYPWGVTLYGVIRSTDATGDKEMYDWVIEHNHIVARNYAWLAGLEEKFAEDPGVRDFMRERGKVKIGGLMRLGNLDSCGAMGVQTLESILRDPARATPEQKAVVERIADWIANKQARLPDGTLWRPNSDDTEHKWPKGTLWIDDLYMACPYLVRWAQYSGDNEPITDAARQIINMADLMQDKDGLWFHAYSVPNKEASPFKWGRANGWAMVAAVEVLSAMPEDHPERAKLLDVLKRHIEGVKTVQPESGVWRQVLDKPELWEETSCTAMFAYSIARAVNKGWIAPENMDVARKAFAGLANYVTPEGVVKGTCRGTSIGLTLDYYRDRERPDDDLHGRGVVMLAGAEILAGKK